VLEEVLRRCRAIPHADAVVCAIPDQPEDDALIPLVKRAGCALVRGSTTDVLARYRQAADEAGADVIMRVTSDCPLIDPALCGEVLRRRTETGGAYACNNMPACFPHGLDCEAFTADALRRADAAARNPGDREHVTPWLRRAPEITRASVIGPGGRAMEQRWTLDYPEDYEFLHTVFRLLPPLPAIAPWREVMRVVERHPELSVINLSRRRTRG
jgi:glutamate-1-semialdehyde 2,1-aminomutase/spore coat polysaccharide biosynthesis protein SpsF